MRRPRPDAPVPVALASMTGARRCHPKRRAVILGIALSLAAWAQAQPPQVAARGADGDAGERWFAAGRVVDEHGRAVAGAAVGAFGMFEFVDTARLLAAPQAVTGADGTFSLEVGRVLGHGHLIVVAEGRQARRTPLHAQRGAAQGPLREILLIPGARLAGRVRDGSRRPVPGAGIRVTSSVAAGGAEGLLAGAVSDADGIFCVPGVPTTGMCVTVEAVGHLTERRLASQQTPLDLELRRVGVVRGRVVGADGAPVADVEIDPVAATPVWTRQAVTSAADGTFALTVPCEHRYRILGFTRAPPFRTFGSTLLRGPADDVVLTDLRSAAPEVRLLEVHAVDARGKAIPRFGLSLSVQDPADLHTAWLRHLTNRRDCTGPAMVEVGQRPAGARVPTVVVDAPGHAFAVVAVGDPPDGTLEVALDPEAVLTGRVLDAATGRPMSGVTVRVLPKGAGRGDAFATRAGEASGADGRYRAAGLRAGDHLVQAHAAGRPSSPVVAVRLAAAAETSLDIRVPAERRVRCRLTGEVPPGVHAAVGVRSGTAPWEAGRYEQRMAAAPFRAVTRSGLYDLGAIGNGLCEVHLRMPSRTRVGGGVTVLLAEVDPDGGPAAIALPDLRMRIQRGRALLPDAAPTERIAVRFHLLDAPVSLQGPAQEWAALDADGRFAVDLLPGRYGLQLVDLLTGIAFHGEADAVVVGGREGTARELAITPAIHWLSVECTAVRPGPILLQEVRIDVPDVPDGAMPVGRAGRREVRQLFRRELLRQRWLVPAGHIEVQAMQAFGMLAAWSDGYGHGRGQTIETAGVVHVSSARHLLELAVAAPPSDDELRRRDR